MKLYLDFETNGLLRKRDLRIHCMAYAIDAQPVQLVVGHDEVVRTLHSLLSHVGPTRTLVAHYGTGFDFPVIRRFTKMDPEQAGWAIRDTKVLGSLYDPEFSGTHSLQDWGVRVKAPKDDYQARCEALGIDPWAAYTDEMGAYCVQDVETLRKVDLYLADKYEREYSWGFSVDLEHAMSRIMAEQAHVGWWFDMPAAVQLKADMQAKVAQLTEECRAILQSKCIPGQECSKPFRKDGSPAALAMRWLGEDAAAWDEAWAAEKKAAKAEKRAPVMPASKVAGCFSQVAFAEYDLDSRQQVIELLEKHGWVPTEYTEKGNPKFSADVKLPENLGPVGKALATRFVTITRLGQLEGWMGKVREDGRIEAKAFANATPTARMRHSVVVNVPKVGTEWGVEMRSLFAAAPGKWQVGVDASSLELRMLAHYMGDPEFIRQVVSGDVHWMNVGLLGLVEPGVKRDKDGPDKQAHHVLREALKRWVYALIYGAGDEKLSWTLMDSGVPGFHGLEDEGKLTRHRFMTGLPKLRKLMDRIEETLFEVKVNAHGERRRGKKKRSYLVGLDGRRIYIRHDHAALNALLQSAGSIVVKAATAYCAKAIKRLKLKARQVGHFHDEAQFECDDEATCKLVAEQFILGLKWAGKKFGVRCPLDGEYKIGRNWADTH